MISPILLFGDAQLCKKHIVMAKKKYSQSMWVELSAIEKSPDEIRLEAGVVGWGIKNKIIIIKELPNKKAIRKFLLNLVATKYDNVKFIIWDSTNIIKLDPKKNTINKTWQAFINDFKQIEGSKIVNNGFDFTEKEKAIGINFIQKQFKKYNCEINNISAKLFIELVGKNRGLLVSEIQKLSLTAPKTITNSFLIENVYTTSKEAIIYKLTNIIDECKYNKAILMIEDFLRNDINCNVIAEVLAKKARWQLAAISLWYNGCPWKNIANELMNMGKFPSMIMHNSKIDIYERKKISNTYPTIKERMAFLNEKMGLPLNCFEVSDLNAKKKGEILPMSFIAIQTAQFIQNKIIIPNQNRYNELQLKNKVLDRAIKVYNNIVNNLKIIRYEATTFQGVDISQILYSMVQELIDIKI